ELRECPPFATCTETDEREVARRAHDQVGSIDFCLGRARLLSAGPELNRTFARSAAQRPRDDLPAEARGLSELREKAVDRTPGFDGSRLGFNVVILAHQVP